MIKIKSKHLFGWLWTFIIISGLIVDKGWHMPIQTAEANFIFAFAGLILLLSGIILMINKNIRKEWYPNDKSLIEILLSIIIGSIFVFIGMYYGISKLNY